MARSTRSRASSLTKRVRLSTCETVEVVNKELPALWRGEKTAREVMLEIKRQTDPILKQGV